MSIAGGLHEAAARAGAVRGTALQIFTSSSNQWRARTITEDEAAAFKKAVEAHGVRKAFAHDSYLINVGSANPALWKRSLAALTGELERAEQLGLDYVVMHPGAHVGAGEESCFGQIAKALDEIHVRAKGYRAMICLEVTAGQGSCVGHRFPHMAEILKRVKEPERIGLCLDTCHLFAAGYDIRTKEGYEAMVAELEKEAGVSRVRCFHLNDAKKPLGSRVDRHEHIGKGCMGLEPFRMILNDPRFAGLPMVLETPKEDDLKEDIENLKVLRSLIQN